MLTVGQVHAAEQQFRLGVMGYKVLPLLRRQQPDDSGKVVLLIKVKQDLAVVGVLHNNRTRIAGLSPGRPAGDNQTDAEADPVRPDPVRQ